MCLVAFQKNFRKIFSGVWKRRRKIQIQKKTHATTQKKIAINGERGRSEIAIDASRDHAVDRDLGSWSTARSSDWICRRTGSRLWLVFFWICVFLLLFQTQENIFRKIFEMQPNTWKHFPFLEISISGKYVFSGKRFTTTKHSLRYPILLCYFLVCYFMESCHETLGECLYIE